MSTTSRIAAGVTAGYLLGRHKKLKLAIIVGSAIANKRIVGSGLSSGLNKLQEASGGGGVGGKLLDAGKGAALATVSHRIDALSDRMSERSEALRGGADDEDEPEDEEAEDEEAEDAEAEDAEAEDEDEPADEAEDEDEPADEGEDEDDLEDWDDDEEAEDEEAEEQPRSRRKRS